MDKNRADVIREIMRMETAIRKTSSPHLAADYTKRIKRLRRELAAYDRYKKEA